LAGGRALRHGNRHGAVPFDIAAHGRDFHSRLRWGAGAGIHFLDGETNRPV
jgi:hypothetical protein